MNNRAHIKFFVAGIVAIGIIMVAFIFISKQSGLTALTEDFMGLKSDCKSPAVLVSEIEESFSNAKKPMSRSDVTMLVGDIEHFTTCYGGVPPLNKNSRQVMAEYYMLGAQIENALNYVYNEQEAKIFEQGYSYYLSSKPNEAITEFKKIPNSSVLYALSQYYLYFCYYNTNNNNNNNNNNEQIAKAKKNYEKLLMVEPISKGGLNI